MKALVFGLLILVLVGISVIFFSGYRNVHKDVKATVSLDSNIQTFLNFTITSGANVAFGEINPGGSQAAPAGGTITEVTTNNPLGYAISINDNVPGGGSALLHDDGVTYIPDYAGTIAAPTIWSGTGLGFTIFAGNDKDPKWGAGGSYNDPANRYAGIPENSSMAYLAPGMHLVADQASWAFKLGIGLAQKQGSYSGSATLTATAVLP